MTPRGERVLSRMLAHPAWGRHIIRPVCMRQDSFLSLKSRQSSTKHQQRHQLPTESMPAVFRFSTELRETGYIVEADLEAKLVELFGPGDYRISVSLHHSVYEIEAIFTTQLPDQARKMDILCTTKIDTCRSSDLCSDPEC